MNKGLDVGMKGRYFEIEENGKIRFFEIHIVEYDKRMLERLKRINCLEDSKLWQYVKLINNKIPENTKYLYKLEIYISNIGIEDLQEFNSKIKDYKVYGFYHIDDLLNFCLENWQVKKEDFKPIYETNIPN